MAITARAAALIVLERVRRDGAFSDSLLSSVLAKSGLEPRDRGLVTRLGYGVLQNERLLDFYIDAFTDGKKKLEPKLRDILRLSLYQLLLMDAIAEHAAVNEGVELARAAGFTKAAGLVNAVLRRAQRSRGALPEPPRERVSEYLSIKYSTPEALVVEFISEFGEDFTEKLLESNNAPAPLTVRVNTLKTTAEELIKRLEAEGVTAVYHEFAPDALNLTGAGDISQLQCFKDGLFYVQDAASILAVLAAAPKSGDKVLDACAAPGGKSFGCAIIMKNRGRLVSCDIHENKLGRIERGAKTLGVDIISTQVRDAAKPYEVDIIADQHDGAGELRGEFDKGFDLVLADVPCSGLGVIRKKPDIRNKRLEDLARLPEKQLEILSNVSRYVKPGGALVYCTCTILRRENEGVTQAFLAKHPEFSAESFILPEPIGSVPSGSITLYPHIHGTDGFFISRFRRREEG
jgi:16S rRNA (cytosine967-C5)-methyltransferase